MVGETVCGEVATPVTPVSATEVAPVTVQLSDEFAPTLMEDGDAVKLLMTGAVFTVTVAVAEVLPPLLVAVSV